MKQQKKTKLGQWLAYKGINQTALQNASGISRTTCYRLCNDSEHTPSLPVIRAVIKAIQSVDPQVKSSDFFEI
ncbi:helix-turn-helix domain-containing protein [Bacillus toyonensis]|uniref:helix-turn-helix domain-containing protein n=1 Tax=Bacillus toyonensis TaxID=155322 RepID=UPI003D661F7A